MFVDFRIRNAKVAGSIPVTGTIKINELVVAFIPGIPQISFCVLVGVLVWQDINPALFHLRVGEYFHAAK